MVSLLEGGYNLGALARCAEAHVLELSGHSNVNAELDALDAAVAERKQARDVEQERQPAT